MQLGTIYRYPVKSAKGQELDRATLDRFGIAGDRRWMLVDDAGQFYSQRRAPNMALLEVASMAGGLRLSFAGDRCEVRTPDPRSGKLLATVWEQSMPVYCADAAVNAWLSQCLQTSLRLVYCPDDASRPVDPAYLWETGLSEQHVSFADGFPLLIISEASLEDLNARLPASVPMDRFRPNLVIRGAAPYAEDGWRRLRIGATTLAVVKPCSRCAIPSIDQQTAERDAAINPMLASYRRRNGEIYFGMNGLVLAGEGFSVGDTVEVLA